jgi:hypothetical protein
MEAAAENLDLCHHILGGAERVARREELARISYEEGKNSNDQYAMPSAKKNTTRTLRKENSPIASLLHPIQIVPQEIVVRRTGVKVPVRRHRAVAQHQIPTHGALLQ